MSVRPWSKINGAGSRSLFIVSILTLIISSSIAIRSNGSDGSDGSSSISANCDECHEPSIYLVLEIQYIDAPSVIIRNESTMVNVTVEVSGSHKSYVWSGFGMDVWLVGSTDQTDCGPHRIINGKKPHGSSSPYTWTETFSFQVNSSLEGNETITVNARMSPIHESPPVTAEDRIVIPVATSKDGIILPSDSSDPDKVLVSPRDNDRSNKLGLVGSLIVIIGSIAVVSGLVYMVYAILSPVDMKNGKGKEGEL